MTIYVVSTTGSNANGTGSLANPWATFAYASNLMADGDLLYVRGGTYDEAMLNRFPSGIDANHKTRIVGHPGDSVPVIAPSTATSANAALRISTKSDQSYEGLDFNGLESNIDTVKLTDTASRIDLIGCTVRNAPQQGVLMTGTGSAHLLRNCTIYGNGTAYASIANELHNVYISVPDVVVEDCNIYAPSDPGGYGIHAYGGDPSRLIVRRCQIHDGGDYGVGLFTGEDMRVENCLFWGAATTAGLRMAYSATRAVAYHNTILNAFYNGGSPTTDCVVTNNIIWPLLANVSTGSTGTVFTNNFLASLTDNGTGTITTNNQIGVDPLFVNQGGGDFHLLGTSPAIGAGIPIGVTTDYDGLVRIMPPSIGAFDITNRAPSGGGGGAPRGTRAYRRGFDPVVSRPIPRSGRAVDPVTGDSTPRGRRTYRRG